MLMTASGLSSGIQNPAYHENKTGAKINQRRPNFPPSMHVMSKPELRQTIESMAWDDLRKDQKIENLLCEISALLRERIQLKDENIANLREIKSQKQEIVRLKTLLNDSREYESPLEVV